MTSLELMTEEVQVWVASLEVSAERYAALTRALPADERDRAKTFSPIAGRRFVVARGILRSLLSGFTGVAPDKLRFSYGNSGKPALIDRDDIENERPVRRLLDVAQRFMSEDELRMLANTPPGERDAAFLRSWVVREARLKADGKGVWSGSGNGDRDGKLTHKLFTPRPNYIAAIAAPDSDWRLYTCAMKD